MKTTWMSAVAVTLLVSAMGCGGSKGEGEITGATEGTSSAITADVPIGSIMQTTGNLNLRAGPSTSNSILHVIPKGAQVVTVNTTTPQNSFYNVKHNGVEGWAHGAYLTLVTPGPGDDGGQGDDGGGPPPPPSGPRADAVARAGAAVGFSYWWGHGRWLDTGPTSSTAGSCSGSCPSCSHSGSYGADCSGYVAKLWQLPSGNTDPTVDSHPYSTYNFYNESDGWHDVDRGSVQLADALTYRSGSAGHIFLYESGDGWGSMWTYEAKGCATGIVHDLRTASSAYKAIGHDGW
jgi:hypothetical protein